MISDRVVRFSPDSENSKNEKIVNIIVCEVLEVNGKEPKRAKSKKLGDYSYVLVHEGTHTFEIEKKKRWGTKNEESVVIELIGSVEAGMSYEVRGTEDKVDLIKIER